MQGKFILYINEEKCYTNISNIISIGEYTNELKRQTLFKVT